MSVPIWGGGAVPVNPRLRVDWPDHCQPGVACICGARYRDFRISGLPRDSRKRLHWAKRQVSQPDGDAAWFWSRRTLLYVLRWVKSSEFVAAHLACGEHAAQEAA